MVYELKNESFVKEVPYASLTTVVGYPANLGDIVLFGVRAGVVTTPKTDQFGNALSVCSVDFNPEKFWNVAEQIDTANLPAVGGKLYVDATSGKLTSVATSNTFAGTYWGVDGDAYIASFGL